MSRKAPTRLAEDELRDAICEDDLHGIIAELRRCGYVDDATDWLGLA